MYVPRLIQNIALANITDTLGGGRNPVQLNANTVAKNTRLIPII
jgi:hypothetical protein